MNWRIVISDGRESVRMVNDLTDKNHIFNHRHRIKEIYAALNYLPLHDRKLLYDKLTERYISYVQPSGYIVMHVNGNLETIWENFEDFKLRLQILQHDVKSYDFGYVLGTASPFGPMAGLQSAAKIPGYEMWQQVTYYKPTTL